MASAASRRPFLLIVKIVVVLMVFALGAGAGLWYSQNYLPAVTTPEKTDKYQAFVYEVYDLIKDKYWDKIDDEKLSSLYELAIVKLTGNPKTLKKQDKEGVWQAIDDAIRNLSDDKKKVFVTSLSDIVLANLNPAGRSRLYTEKMQQDLSQVVQNIDPQKDLYQDLGVGRDASKEQIDQQFRNKQQELESKAQTSPEAREELEKIRAAYEVLSNDSQKLNYDARGALPTSTGQVISNSVAYIKLDRFSPTTFDEFQNTARELDKGDTDSLILDMRGNIGGAIDLLPYFLGPFIGQDQYAYELFQQGEKEPVKTKVGWLNSLVRYKKVVVLVDRNSQSTAELMAATLKKYNVGVLVGEKTKGWGTIEQVMELKNQLDDTEKYSVFLVHHITLREDGQPIEGNGVDPHIDVNNPNWKQELLSYYNYQPLVTAISLLLERP